MRYSRLFGVVLVALCALGSVGAACALASTVLPTTITSYKGKGVGKTKLEKSGGLASVECESAKGEGTVEANGHSGMYHVTFEKCSAAGGPCTGLGDTTETILSLGSYHFVYSTLKASLTEPVLAILFLVGSVHFVCNVPILGEILQEVFLGGMVLCLIENQAALTKVFEFSCKEGQPDHPLLSKYYTEGGTLVKISPLMSAESEGTEAEGAQVGNGTIEYPEPAGLMV
jgi:hypothetical protein